MGKEELRSALFNAVERVTNHPLYDSGQKIILHYFNSSHEDTAFERAIYAINKYFPESIPDESTWSKGLAKAMAELKKRADEWDKQDE